MEGERDLDMIEEIDWDSLFVELGSPDSGSILENYTTTEAQAETVTLSPPDEVAWIEKALMEDDQIDDNPQTNSYVDGFLADIFVESPPSSSSEIIDDSPAATADAAVEIQQQEITHSDDNDNDPSAKKLKRQLRNRDAAVRSRERKKKYVTDLEMKSRYLEGECRRLGRMLQCFIAENQTLRFTLQKGCAFDASSAKQESAVLFLESLLLGSLLWSLCIMCLFTLPALPKAFLEMVPLEKEKRNPERVAPRGPGSSLVEQSYVISRRCKGSRGRMKGFCVYETLATCNSILSLSVCDLGTG